MLPASETDAGSVGYVAARPRWAILDREVRMTIIMVMDMVKSEPFAMIDDPKVRPHLDVIELKYHALIRTTTEEQ